MTKLPVGLTFNQLGAMLRYRVRTVLLVIAATVAATGALLMVIPKSYTSSAELYIEYRVNDPISGRQFPAVLDESYLQTQVDILTSNEAIDRVIDSLHLLDKGSDGSSRQQLRERLSKSIEVGLQRSSRILGLQYSDRSPEAAREFLNTLIQTYIDINTEVSVGPAKSRMQQYNAQLQVLRDQMDETQQKLTEYQQREKIVDTDERMDTSTKQFAELSSRQLQLRMQRQEYDARMRALDQLLKSGTDVADLPEVAQQPRVTELKLRLADVDRRINEVMGTYGSRHPRLLALKDERDGLLQTLHKEASTALQGLRLEGVRLQDQESSLGRNMQEQQEDLLETKKHRDVIASLQRQFESTQRIYNAAVSKYDEILMSGTVNSTSVTVLRRAEAPLKHSKPLITKSLLMSVFVGLALGLGLSFLLEIGSRRLRCTEDMERSLNLRLFVQIGKSTL